MFMRVQRTVPQFTFILSKRFVNQISSVSTGFFRFFSVLFKIRYILGRISEKSPTLTQRISPSQKLSRRFFVLLEAPMAPYDRSGLNFFRALYN